MIDLPYKGIVRLYGETHTALRFGSHKSGGCCARCRLFTRAALHGVGDMGLTLVQAIAAIQSLVAGNFHKSMTTYADHRVWQDVYHAATPDGLAYVKFTLRDDGSVVISFKELEP